MLRTYTTGLMLMCSAAALAACGSTDEINFIAGDSKISLSQDDTGSYRRTDAGVLGDLSDTLPEGVVPVGQVMSPQGQVTFVEPEEGTGGGFNFSNIRFQTARQVEARAAAQEAGVPLSSNAEGEERPGLLMRLLGMSGGTQLASDLTGAPLEVGADGLPESPFEILEQGGVNVNRYLWNATAQTLSFMPVAQADQARGLYSTGWYSDDARRPERVRIDVQHVSETLNPASFHVTMYRQIMQDGVWRGAPASLPAARALEQRILELAQQIRIAEEEDARRR